MKVDTSILQSPCLGPDYHLFDEDQMIYIQFMDGFCSLGSSQLPLILDEILKHASLHCIVSSRMRSISIDMEHYAKK